MTQRRRQTPPTSSESPRQADWALWSVFAGAFVVRLIHVASISRAPFFTTLFGDSRTYDAWALQIASGDWLGRDVFYQSPLYPYLLAVVYAVAGHDVLVVRVAQAALGALACVLIACAGTRLWSRRVGLTAEVALALYAPAIFFDGLIQKSSVDGLLACLVIWIVARASDALEPERRPRVGVFLALGAALGALALSRENAVLLVPVVLGWCVVRGATPRQRMAGATALAAGALIVLGPVALRNRAIGGEWVITTSQFGPNFYIGNNPDADGTYRALRFGRSAAEYERADATEIAQAKAGRVLSSVEVSRFWRDEALAYITTRPLDWARLMARKWALLWNATEVADAESQRTHEEWSPLLRVLAVPGHFGVLVPLAVVGVAATWPDRRRLAILYVLAAAYAASVLAFYVFARYRYPLVPFLVLFASAGIVNLRQVAAGWRMRRSAAVAVVVIATAVFANWPMLSATGMQAVSESNLANVLREAGRTAEAESHYRRAIALRDDFAVAHGNLGILLAEDNRIDDAVAEFTTALTIDPAWPAGHRRLGKALALQGRTAEAVASLQKAVSLDADDVEARHALARVLFATGGRAGAEQQFVAALRLSPADADLHNDYGTLLASDGRLEAAIAEFEHALALRPGHALAQRNLALARGAAVDAMRR